MTQTKTHIVITGEAGVGKSTLAKLLSKELGFPCKDLDQEVGTLPSDEAFRTQEKKTLAYLLSNPDRNIISTGGGTIMFINNRDKITEGSVVIHLLAADYIKERNIMGDSSRTVRHQYSKHDDDVRMWVTDTKALLINVMSTMKPEDVCRVAIDHLSERGLIECS